MSDLNSLLDCTLDELADLPSFKPFPIGSHRVLVSMEQREVSGKVAVEMSFTYMEVIELEDPAEEVPAAGDTANTLFFLSNETGQAFFKKAALPLGAALGFTTLREIIEGVKDVECIIQTGLRKDKTDPTRMYLQLKDIGVV